MKSKLTKLAQVTALGLSLALTFSCSSDDDGGGNGDGDVLSSSSVDSPSGAISSSSNAPTDCVGFVEGTRRVHNGKSKPQFCDARDGKRYVYVEIGNQTWMAENINYKTTGFSWCYGGQESNCDAYGRLYDWNVAKSACPSGWSLPSQEDWETLIKFINPICVNKEMDYCPDAATKLKAANGWYAPGIPQGTDDYGFSALPGGAASLSDDVSYGIGSMGFWWSISENSSDEAYSTAIFGDDEDFFGDYDDKSNNFYSVRCIQGDSPSSSSSSPSSSSSSSTPLGAIKITNTLSHTIAALDVYSPETSFSKNYQVSIKTNSSYTISNLAPGTYTVAAYYYASGGKLTSTSKSGIKVNGNTVTVSF